MDDPIDFTVGSVDPAAQMTTTFEDGSDVITISLDDVSLEDTIRLFTQTTGANIIASGALLEGRRVTVNLRDVDWRPALRSILDIHGLALVERSPGSGIYSIQAKVPDAPEPTQVETFFLDYTTVSDVKEAITAMLSANAVITTFPSRNALVVRTSEANLGEVKALIDILDRPGRQVLIEARILELTDDARKAVGIDWSILDGYRIGITDAQWEFSDSRRRTQDTRNRGITYDMQGRGDGSLLFRDPDGNLMSADKFESWRASPNPAGAFTDAEWEGTPTRYQIDERYRGQGFENIQDRSSSRIYEEIKSAILSPADFSVLLSALHSTDGVSIVSNPKMIVTSGSTNAFFSVGFREPIIETEILRGNPAIGQADLVISRLATGINTDFIKEGYLEEGIDLRVVATVKTDDFIEADIRPSLRRKVDEKFFGDNSWPILSVKEIDTSFTLRSGQTVAIGGLTGTEDFKRSTRVPILGSIPLIGRLFRHDEDLQKQTETIIFVTLTVADPEGLVKDAGIPEDSRLVHSRLLRDQARREEFQRQLNEMRGDHEEAVPVPSAEIQPRSMAEQIVPR